MSNRALDVVDNILSSPRQWTKGVAARDKYGNVVAYDSDAAHCFCLTGALSRADMIARVSNPEYSDAQGRLAKAIEILKGPQGVTEFNDSERTTFADVKAVIAYARAM